MREAGKQTTNDSIKKPPGGYRMISVPQICMAWRAYKTRLLPKFYDVCVYFALHETDERRRAENRKRRNIGRMPRRFAFDRTRLVTELQDIVEGLSFRLVSASVRRLEGIGLVSITRHEITFARHACELRDTDLDGVDRMLGRIDRRGSVQRRAVPVPRRMLRYLARESTPGVAATLLAHAMRCLWLHRSTYRFVGTCSARFVAEVFEANTRTVMRARQRLRSPQVKWLVPLVTAPHVYQRYGSRVAINPRWERSAQPARASECRLSDRSVSSCARLEPAASSRARGSDLSRPASGTVLSPPPARNATEMSPPIINKNLLAEVQQPNPRNRRDDGVYPRVPSEHRPNWRRITPADLISPVRLQELLQQVRRQGLVGDGEADRLAFFAAAAHALRVGTRNQPGLFAAVVQRKLWHHITQADEDAARRILMAFDIRARCGDDSIPVARAPQSSRRAGIGNPEALCDVAPFIASVVRSCGLDTPTRSPSGRVPAGCHSRKRAA